MTLVNELKELNEYIVQAVVAEFEYLTYKAADLLEANVDK